MNANRPCFNAKSVTDLFADLPDARPDLENIAEGAVVLPGFAKRIDAALLREINAVIALSPLTSMEAPGGRRM